MIPIVVLAIEGKLALALLWLVLSAPVWFCPVIAYRALAPTHSGIVLVGHTIQWTGFRWGVIPVRKSIDLTEALLRRTGYPSALSPSGVVESVVFLDRSANTLLSVWDGKSMYGIRPSVWDLDALEEAVKKVQTERGVAVR